MEWVDKTSTCHQTHNMGRHGLAHRVKVNQVLSGTRGSRMTLILKNYPFSPAHKIEVDKRRNGTRGARRTPILKNKQRSTST